MNPWTLAAAILVALTVPPLALMVRGRVMDAVVGLELIGVLLIWALLLLAVGDSDPALSDPALVLAFLSLGSAIVFVRYFERWM